LPFPLQADAGADVKATDPDKTQAHKSAKIILDTKPSMGKRRLKNQPEFTAAVKPDGKQRWKQRVETKGGELKFVTSHSIMRYEICGSQAAS
jgi:hypothetical protein